ncbi:MAG: sugar ABC transporter ATP-binding protein [Firmicutes bacterium]|nr:sugar ABC transporter ATP-binding protein [Bacillota bacterium]
MCSKLLEMKKINKSFPGVKALENVDLSLESGEIKALLGENGAGKSTLIKILAGIYQADSGEIYLEGDKVSIREPEQAKELGLAFIHQDVNLIPYFNVIENIWLGYKYPKKGIFFSKDKMEEKVKELADNLNFKLDLYSPVKRLATADKCLVAILKAFMMNARILVLDEPTAALTDKEIKELFINLKKIRDRGMGIIYISHRLEEIFEIADSITVLKNGVKVADSLINKINKDGLISLMTGKKSLTRFPEKEAIENRKGLEILKIKNLTGDGFNDINFNLYQGEVLGFFGLVGAGRTELMEAICGLNDISDGEIILEDNILEPKNPYEVINKGIVLIPEDRREEGLVLNMSVLENLSLPNLPLMLKSKILKNIDKGREKNIARKYVNELQIKTPSLDQRIKFLSGGNQQKVVIGKWLMRDNSVIIFDEPTVGIDVGARSEVYNLINNLTKESGIIVVSSDLPEIVGICDRVAVMANGQITGILVGEDITEEKILNLSYQGV